jgi:hypothetical protein
MDNHYTLKIKLGTDEFEAAGPVEVVEAQFKIFTYLVAERQATAALRTGSPGDKDSSSTTTSSVRADVAVVDAPREIVEASSDKIMRVDARIVSLKARPQSSADAVLLILYGQKLLRNNESVTGSEVIRGLAPGGLSIARVDRRLEHLSRSGDVMVMGRRRSKRYSLTNAGLAKARQIAAGLLAT